MPYKILIVEDDPSIADIVVYAMERAGHQVLLSKDGERALVDFNAWAPDLIILDVGLPGQDGLEVCKSIRRTSDVPILFLSARDEEIDRILGLEIGGDDYVTKPFSPRELSARVANILRRENKKQERANGLIAYGRLSLDADRHEVCFDDQVLALTATEFTILQTLLLRPGIVWSRAQLLESAYKGLSVSDRTIDSHIRNLRAKLVARGGEGIIETVHGVGFRLVSSDQ